MKDSVRSARFWVLTLAALVVAGVTFSLGQWQLRRAAQKEALHDAVAARGALAALAPADLMAAPEADALLHRPAALTGTWQSDHTVYLDNRPMDGKTGFVVVTPLQLQASTQVILVQRGWVLRNFEDRTRLPAVATPSGLVRVQGRIAPPPSKLYAFEGVETGRIRQNLDVAAFRAETGLPLLAVSLLQTGDASDGLQRDWAAPNRGVDKHYGYAFQWFGLCGLVVFLYLWFQLVLPIRSASRSAS